MDKKLNSQIFDHALNDLTRCDVDLARVIRDYGRPTVLRRSAGFMSLVLLILEQQVSLASADACYKRLVAAVPRLNPKNILALSALNFRDAGVSRQKTRYIRDLAEAVLDKRLTLQNLVYLSDEEVRENLCQVKGVGPWTADVYLLACLQRPDVWPSGDIALQTAVRDIKGLKIRPDQQKLIEIGEVWRPWRSVAAGILWHYYLKAVRKK